MAVAFLPICHHKLHLSLRTALSTAGRGTEVQAFTTRFSPKALSPTSAPFLVKRLDLVIGKQADLVPVSAIPTLKSTRKWPSQWPFFTPDTLMQMAFIKPLWEARLPTFTSPVHLQAFLFLCHVPINFIILQSQSYCVIPSHTGRLKQWGRRLVLNGLFHGSSQTGLEAPPLPDIPQGPMQVVPPPSPQAPLSLPLRIAPRSTPSS